MLPSRESEPGFGEWLLFWAQFAVLGFFAVLGAFVASDDASPGNYGCGLILSLSSIALAFMRLKHGLDGASAAWADFLLVDDMTNLIAVVVVFTLVALAGLFAAARYDHGALHDSGVALFAASGLAVFLSLKRVFDNVDRRG